jgi:alpha-tubulin suppressor-like RCC1 family protein
MLFATPLRLVALALLLLIPQAPAVAQSIVPWGRELPVTTDVPGDLAGITKLAAGFEHALALQPDGTVAAWGSNTYGQLNVPVGLTDVVQVAAGTGQSLALREDGSVASWGSNDSGLRTVPAGLRATHVAAGDWHSVAVRTDGTVAAWGRTGSGRIDVPDGLTDVIQVAAGAAHTLALRSDGTVVAWGQDFSHQTRVPEGLSDVVSIAAGGNFSAALQSDGTAVFWGGVGTSLAGIAPIPGVAEISIGSNHVLVRMVDGTVTAFGSTTYGQTSVPADLNDVIQVTAGGSYSLALVDDGSGVSTEPEDTGRALALSIEAVYPNPSRGAVTVGFSLEAPGAATVEVYDMLGRRVALLHEGATAAGGHQVRWEAGGVAAGVYLVRLVSEGAQATRAVTITGR